MKSKKAIFGFGEGFSTLLWIAFLLIVLGGIGYAVYILTHTQ
jgi:preprotein translocase subunit Sss1